MLHSPVNAYPHNECVDINYPIPFTFTHHGSMLTHCHYNIYNTEDASSVVDWWVDYAQSVYNGDDVSSILFDDENLRNGSNYKWNVTQYIGNANIYAARGSVLPKEFIEMAYTKQSSAFQEGMPEGVTVTDIEQFIPVAFETAGIEAPIYVEGEFIGGQYLEINGERRLILGYWESYPLYLLYQDTYTSAIIIDKPFSTFPTTSATQTWRHPYRIFKNYLTSPYFYMKARTMPSLNANMKFANGQIQCSATYSQDNASLIESYRWDIQNIKQNDIPTSICSVRIASEDRIRTLTSMGVVIDNMHIPLSPTDMTDEITNKLIGNKLYYLSQVVQIQSYDVNTSVATLESPLVVFPMFEAECLIYEYNTIDMCHTDSIYNERLSTNFWVAPYDLPIQGTIRIKTTDGALQERTVFSGRVELPASATIGACNAQAVNMGSDCFVKITWSLIAAAVGISIYKSVDGGTFVPLAKGIDTNASEYKDYMVGREHTYQYMVLPTNTNGDAIGAPVYTEFVQVNYKGWLLTSLKENITVCDYRIYEHGDTWNFNIDLTDSDVTHNTNRAYFMGGGRFPKQYKTFQRYINGSLSSLLGSVDCSTRRFDGDIRKLEAWRQFVFDNDLFLLRSSKGDCWIVTIDANPTETYPIQKWDKIVPVTVKFDYTEVLDSSKAIVR